MGDKQYDVLIRMEDDGSVPMTANSDHGKDVLSRIGYEEDVSGRDPDELVEDLCAYGLVVRLELEEKDGVTVVAESLKN